MRKLILLQILFLQAFAAFATGDSLNYLTLKDTIFLSRDANDTKIFEHTLVVVRVPIPNKAIIRYKGNYYNEQKHIPVFYVVKKGDTMYSLSSRFFKMPADTIMARNNMTSSVLSLGQHIFVGWMSIEGITGKQKKPAYVDPCWHTSQRHEGTYRAKYKYHKEIKKNGAAYWNRNLTAKGTGCDLFVLHRSAAVGSVIKIRNYKNNKIVYAKVTGSIPYTYEDSVHVVVSAKIAKLLGAKDAKFYTEVRYLQ